MVPLSRRLEPVTPFMVMEILERARELEAQGRAVIHMEVGEPDFPTSPVIVEAMKAAGTTTDVSAICDALHEIPVPTDDVINGYIPIDGKWFDANGQAWSTNVACVWEDGRWRYVEDLPSDAQAYYEYVTSLREANGN
jgi:hypothetical protein